MRGAINLLQLGMNFLTKATMPKNNCKLVMLVGRVKLVMAFIFSGLGFMPSPLIRSQEGQTLLIELTLSGLGKQLVFPKRLENCLEIFLVVFFGFTEDNNVVKIYYYAIT